MRCHGGYQCETGELEFIKKFDTASQRLNKDKIFETLLVLNSFAA